MYKNIITILLTIASFCLANGVAIIDAVSPSYFNLLQSSVEVTIENQVAITKATQIFQNNTGKNKTLKYAFPLAEQASAISLRWHVNKQWYSASFASTPQDTTLPGPSGEEMNYNLRSYLGETPLYFDLTDTLTVDSLIIFELTYVELLPYEFGKVIYFYPNNYELIQNNILNKQIFTLSLISERNIEAIELPDLANATILNDGHTAHLEWQDFESAAIQDYSLEYTLNLNELGLFGLSTYLADSLVPDKAERGFFIFVAEPDPSENTNVINKVFTLIIDGSGSMGGDKIVQALNAASFIVEHLNEGDSFNIVDFSDNISSFRPGHIEYSATNETLALDYISGLVAGGSTNISGAFSTAIPQFSTANDTTANIIIFFTDGQATAGITNTHDILSHVNDLTASAETDLTLFTFGIGSDVNEQLLSLLATQNGGLVEFLRNDELESRITNFYLRIQNPVLLNTQMTFLPQVVTEAFPLPLPNLYKGQQMIVAGRYTESAATSVTLSGEAYGQPVHYTYNLMLEDSTVDRYQFLTKIWAKKKIEDLLILYYSYNPGSNEAEEIKDVIIYYSVNFGVITPFTSFSEDNPLTNGLKEVIDEVNDNVIASFTLLGNFPNPFNPSTTIKFQVNDELNGLAKIKIYNSSAQLIKVLFIQILGSGEYQLYWDGKSEDNNFVASGIYFYVIDFENTLKVGKMSLIR